MTITRRKMLTGISLFALLPLQVRKVAAATPSTGNKGQLCIGLYGPTYYGGMCPFLNWWKIASYPSVTLTNGQKLDGKVGWAAGLFDGSTGEQVGFFY